MKICFILIPVLIIGVFPVFGEPFMLDKNYTVEEYISGLEFPTAMTFVDDDILVLEKGTGNVKLVKNGTLIEKPVLHVDVNSNNERGLLGITSIGSEIYLYYTASEGHLGKAIANQIHRYTWDGQSLINDSLIRQIPTDPKDDSMHNGGAMTVSNDGMVYATVGDARKVGILQNFESGDLEDTGIILKVNYNEFVLEPSKSENPQDYYYAMGIRNSFGLAFDPITGHLWDTENGDRNFDEINLVEPKFNSGWAKIMGPATEIDIKNLPSFYDFKYSNPEFSWEHPVAPTAIIFANSELYPEYQNTVFVGDFNSGSIYKFTLNKDRTGFIFQDPSLQDLVLNFDDSDFEISFGRGFLGVTDLEFGPDGILYVLSVGDGKIYKIVPSNFGKISEKIVIPKWTKQLFSWWNSEKIDSVSLLNSLEYLITKNIIVLKNLPENTDGTHLIPQSFEKNSILWAQEKISEEEFASSLIDLANSSVISVNHQEIKCNSKPKFMSDFSGCDFSSKVLSKLDLSYSTMNKISLKSAIIIETNLELSNLSNSDLSNATLRSVNLRGAILFNSQLSGAELTSSDLSGGDFRKVIAINANFSNSTMFDTNFENSILSGADFSNASLLRVRFNNSDLNQASFTNANLNKALLSNSSLQGANFEGAKLSSIRASSSNFEDANFSNSNLKYSFLENSNFKNANLQGANLQQAEMSNANLEGANLQNSNLRSVNFENVNLTGANLSGADLSNVSLLKTNIDNVNFTGAIKDGCLGCPP